MIKNIVFDMGNVLIRFDPEFFIRRAGVIDPGDRELILRELFRSAEWPMMDWGALDEESTEKILMPRFPERLRETVHQLLWHWADDREMIPGMEELVAELKAAGYRLYLLSNASVQQHVYWPGFPVSRLLDGKLISCDVKVIKPMPEIYRAFTEKFGLKPEECLFIDDAAVNIAGAVRCGWQGIVFHGDAGDLRRKMKAVGIALQGA